MEIAFIVVVAALLMMAMVCSSDGWIDWLDAKMRCAVDKIRGCDDVPVIERGPRRDDDGTDARLVEGVGEFLAHLKEENAEADGGDDDDDERQSDQC